MARRYVLGIDGGGTKTVCLAASEDGEVVGRGSGGPSNYLSEGLEGARRSLTNAIYQAIDQAGITADNVHCICAGLAGVSRRRDEETMRVTLQRILLVPELVLEVDALIALLGATGGRPGVIAISGTGSVAFGVDSQETRARSGGWGFILGDEGSGYDIARRGLIASLRDYDGRGRSTVIRERLSEVLGLSSTEDLIPLLYSNPLSPGRVAALYPIVLHAADENDEVAVNLIRDAAAALAEMAAATSQKLAFDAGELLFTYAGGVFRGRTLRREFVRALRLRVPGARLEEPKKPAEQGAVMLALARLKGERLFAQG